MPLKRIALVAVLALAAVGMQGCANGGPAPSAGVPVATQSAPVAHGAITPASDDARSTVFMLDAAQIGELSGTPLTPDTIDQAMIALTRAKTWAADPGTAKYAVVIAKAFASEQGIAYGAVNAASRNSDARVKVIVLHTSIQNSADVQRSTVGG